jgi:hypothetical protein
MTATQPEGLNMTNSQWLLDMMGRYKFTIPSVAFDEIIDRIELLSASKPAVTDGYEIDFSGVMGIPPKHYALDICPKCSCRRGSGSQCSNKPCPFDRAPPPAAPAQSPRDACQIDNFSGRVCQHGTRSCVADHAAPAQSAKPVGSIQRDNIHGFHMEAKVPWDSLPIGTLLYAAPQLPQTAVVLDERAAFEAWWETVRDDMIQDTDPRRHAEAAWKARAASPQPRTPIAQLIADFEADGFNFSDLDSVKKIALRYVETMPDAQVRALLYTLASAQPGEKS